MPLVSVIIPNYNHAPYLRERIDSVLNQTFQDFELIILDDLSPDNSREVIEQYKDHPNISYIIYNEENSGSTFRQWQKGIELAKGEWIWIAESDDWCEPTLLQNLLAPTNNNKNIGISHCQSIFYNTEKNTFYPHICTDSISEIIDKNEYIERKLLPFNQLVNASMAIFKKELYYQISDEYKNYRLAGDWIFWAEMSRLQDVAICGKFLNYFRQHSVKVSFNVKKTGQSYIEELRSIQYFRNKLGVSETVYEDAITKQYMRFRYDKFPVEDGVREKTNILFTELFTKNIKKRVQKQILLDKIQYKYVAKLLNLFS